MVWPNRGAIGAIGAYGLNVLKLLQDSHRCCRYAPAATPHVNPQDNPASPSAITPIFCEGPGRPVFFVPMLSPPDARGRRAGGSFAGNVPGPHLSRQIRTSHAPTPSPAPIVLRPLRARGRA